MKFTIIGIIIALVLAPVIGQLVLSLLVAIIAGLMAYAAIGSLLALAWFGWRCRSITRSMKATD